MKEFRKNIATANEAFDKALKAIELLRFMRANNTGVFA